MNFTHPDGRGLDIHQWQCGSDYGFRHSTMPDKSTPSFAAGFVHGRFWGEAKAEARVRGECVAGGDPQK